MNSYHNKVLRVQAICADHLTRASEGLDFSDADDRAIFRGRLTDRFRITRVLFIREQGQAMGYGLGPTSRAGAIRHIADRYLEEKS